MRLENVANEDSRINFDGLLCYFDYFQKAHIELCNLLPLTLRGCIWNTSTVLWIDFWRLVPTALEGTTSWKQQGEKKVTRWTLVLSTGSCKVNGDLIEIWGAQLYPKVEKRKMQQGDFFSWKFWFNQYESYRFGSNMAGNPQGLCLQRAHIIFKAAFDSLREIILWLWK